MNKIDEYKKKINYDVWADVTGGCYATYDNLVEMVKECLEDD